MPQINGQNDPQHIRHSDEIQDIITAVPSALLRWGTTIFIGVLFIIIILSAFIRYPDMVKTSLKINIVHPANKMSPENHGTDFYGDMILSQNTLGQIHKGQKVIVRLLAHPSFNGAFLQGKISAISDTADNENVFHARVTLDSDFLRKNSIQLRPGMLADAEIVTQNLTVLKRIFNGFKRPDPGQP